MELDRATGVLVALRRCSCEDASDEILAVSKRHRVAPVAVARALVALAEGDRHDDEPATTAARYEWGSLMHANDDARRGGFSRVRDVVVTLCCSPAALARWVRADYPQWSPSRCHVALVALCGQDGSLLEQKPRSVA